MNAIEGILSSIKDLAKRVGRLEIQDKPTWVYLASPLTSTSWDGDLHSTTAKTVIDLSAVFGAPAGIKAVLLLIDINDTGGVGWFGVSGTNIANQTAIYNNISGFSVNDWYAETGVSPCSAAGDIYYQCVASGASTLGVYLQIWGYYI